MKYVFWILVLVSSILFCPSLLLAQSGGGDLPPVPKASPSKSKTKPAPTSKAKTPAAKTTSTRITVAKEPARIGAINFDEVVEGKIEAQTAGRIPPNVYYEEFAFSATDADLFDIEIHSNQAIIKVELLDSNKINVPLKRNEQTNSYQLNTNGSTLPTDGEYRVRVSVAPSPTLAAAIPFSLKLAHTGLTEAGYQERLQQIVKGFSPQKPDESITQLERLAQDDPKRPGAYEYLGLLYNEFKQDQVKASVAMSEALKRGGAAIFKIAHDSQWRRPNRDRKTQRMAFQDLRTNWLRISSSQIVIADFNVPDRAVLTFPREQIKEVNRVLNSPFFFIKHENKRLKPDLITFGLATPIEADMAVDIIKNILPRKE